jgi:hypothetical protein
MSLTGLRLPHHSAASSAGPVQQWSGPPADPLLPVSQVLAMFDQEGVGSVSHPAGNPW